MLVSADGFTKEWLFWIKIQPNYIARVTDNIVELLVTGSIEWKYHKHKSIFCDRLEYIFAFPATEVN